MCADPEGNEFCIERSDDERTARVEQLGRAFAAVGDLITTVGAEQWSAPTPCTDWTVRQLVEHVIGMNGVFAALLAGEPPPRRADDHAPAIERLVAVLGRPVNDSAAQDQRRVLS